MGAELGVNGKLNVLRSPVPPTLIAIGVVAASVAGTIALTGGHAAGRAGGAAPPTPPPVRNAVWTVDGAHDAPTLSGLTGFWVGPDVVVRGAVDGLHAMKRSDGSDAWDLPTPIGGGGDICGMSPGVDAGTGIGIVVSQGTQGGSATCSSVSGIDVGSGKVLWTTPVSRFFDDPSAQAEDYGIASGMAIIDSDRTATETAVVALDLRTGAEKWKYSPDCEHRPAEFAVGGSRVVVGEECKGTVAARVLDAVTGSPVPNAASLSLSGPSNPRLLSAEPLVVAGDPSNSLFVTLTKNGPSRAQVTVGKDVVCAGGRQAACWSAGGGAAVVPRGLPNAGAEHHDVYPVAGLGDAAQFVTTGVPGHTRASLCRIAADGTVVVEADLSQPVSDYLGKSGTAGSYSVYADAKDLYVVDPHPDGRTAVIDVRLG